MSDDRLKITLVERKNRERWPEAGCRAKLGGVANIALEHAHGGGRWKGGRAERLERNRAAGLVHQPARASRRRKQR